MRGQIRACTADASDGRSVFRRAFPDMYQNPQIGGCLNDLAEQHTPQIDIQSEVRNQEVDGRQSQSTAEQIQEKRMQCQIQSVQNTAECSG